VSGVDESSSDMIPRSGSGSGSRRNKTRRDETGGGVVYAMYSSLPLVFEQPIQNLIYYDVSGHKLRSRGLNL